ncbi:hypothetical protein REPUB_Repub05bG0065600 [Reevesia pubescens]
MAKLTSKSSKRMFPLLLLKISSLTFRIANGEPSDILLAEPVIEFHRSCGTSGGQPKLIPSTAEFANKRAIFGTLSGSVMTKHFGDLNQAGKRMELMFAKQEIETLSGPKARTVSTSAYKSNAFRENLSKHYTGPIETIFCSDTKQNMYCQLLGLIQRDEVVTFGAIYAHTLLRAIKFLEDYWKELCYNIKTGQISGWITDLGCRNALSLIMKPNTKLAASIENICSCKLWDAIIKKLWPKAKFIGAITTGVESIYRST